MHLCRYCRAQFADKQICVQHEILFHQFEPNFTIQCEHSGCPATFSVVSSYYSHRSRHKKARSALVVSQAQSPERPVEQPMDATSECDQDNVEAAQEMDTDSDIFMGRDNDELIDVNLANVPLKELCARYLLHIRANSNMPISVLLSTMRLTENIVQACLSKYACELKESLIEQGLVPDNFEVTPSSTVHVFDGLDTIYKQDQFFETTLNVVKPQVRDLQAPKVAFSGTNMDINRTVELKSPFMVYIPIIETLQSLLKNETFAELLNETQPASSGEFESFLDGRQYKENQFLQNHPDALRIILYYDDLELCDPLGSKAGDHSVGIIYMAVDNIPSRYRSTLQAVHLVGIAKKKDISSCGIDSFLEPVVDDVKKLEKGVVCSNGQVMFGCLIAFIGDNAAVHAVGGFKEGFTAAHPCRTCLAPLHDVRTCVKCENFVMRTDETYREQIRLICEAPSKQAKTELSMEFGLTRKSILNDLQHFSVVQNLPPDAMHDILEGCFPITIKILLKKVIDDKILDLNQINNRINNFDYGYSESTSKPSGGIKPQHLESGGNLRYSASQMWTLAVILPVILGPHIDIDCEYWDVYLCLLQVSALVMSRKLSEDMLEYLQMKVTQYAKGFLEHFRETLIPKQHYLLHYVHYMREYGPVSQFWSMRMEARHQFFKGLAKKMKNFKNIIVSLAKRNQLWETSQRLGTFGKKGISSCGNGIEVSTASCSYRNVLPASITSVVEVPYVEVNNLNLTAKKCCVAVGFDDSECLPMFAFLYAIVMRDDIPLLVCKKVVTLFFDVHVNAYEVELTNDFKVFQVEDLSSQSEIFHFHHMEGRMYIFVKRALGPLF